jgi:hypothetical protein
MAELLVWLVDKTNPDDFYLNARQYKRGDVIAVCPDGWPWGREELNNPHWRIVKVPDMTESEASAFLGKEHDTDPSTPSRTLQRRAFKIDLDHADAGPLLAQSRGRQHVRAVAELLRRLKAAKPRIEDPFVIGESGQVIG